MKIAIQKSGQISVMKPSIFIYKLSQMIPQGQERSDSLMLTKLKNSLASKIVGSITYLTQYP